MNTTVRRALWVVLVLLCLGLVFLALRGVLAVGAVPVSYTHLTLPTTPYV